VDEQRYQDSMAALDRYVDGIRSLDDGASPDQLEQRREAVRAATSNRLESGVWKVHPIPPMPRAFGCLAMRRVVTRAHGYCRAEKEPPNGFNGDDVMDLADGRVTPCAPLMRALRGVMLNGLCEGVRDMSVELDAEAIRDFVQCMRAGVLGSMQSLRVCSSKAPGAMWPTRPCAA
jgi:hypothetical protein